MSPSLRPFTFVLAASVCWVGTLSAEPDSDHKRGESPPGMARRAGLMPGQERPSKELARLLLDSPEDLRAQDPLLGWMLHRARAGWRESDIESAVSLSFQQAMQEEEADLKKLMADMDAARRARQDLRLRVVSARHYRVELSSLREALARLARPPALRGQPSPAKASGSGNGVGAVAAQPPRPAVLDAAIADLDADGMLERIDAEMDWLQALKDEAQLRLQQAPERRQKAKAALSALMRRAHDAAKNAVRNMK